MHPNHRLHAMMAFLHSALCSVTFVAIAVIFDRIASSLWPQKLPDTSVSKETWALLRMMYYVDKQGRDIVQRMTIGLWGERQRVIEGVGEVSPLSWVYDSGAPSDLRSPCMKTI